MNRLTATAASAAALLLLAGPCFAETIFVSNEKDNTITVIDGKTLQVIKTIPDRPASARRHSEPGLQGAVRGRGRWRHHGCLRHQDAEKDAASWNPDPIRS